MAHSLRFSFARRLFGVVLGFAGRGGCSVSGKFWRKAWKWLLNLPSWLAGMEFQNGGAEVWRERRSGGPGALGSVWVTTERTKGRVGRLGADWRPGQGGAAKETELFSVPAGCVCEVFGSLRRRGGMRWTEVTIGCVLAEIPLLTVKWELMRLSQGLGRAVGGAVPGSGVRTWRRLGYPWGAAPVCRSEASTIGFVFPRIGVISGNYWLRFADLMFFLGGLQSFG